MLACGMAGGAAPGGGPGGGGRVTSISSILDATSFESPPGGARSTSDEDLEPPRGSAPGGSSRLPFTGNVAKRPPDGTDSPIFGEPPLPKNMLAVGGGAGFRVFMDWKRSES